MSVGVGAGDKAVELSVGSGSVLKVALGTGHGQ